MTTTTRAIYKKNHSDLRAIVRFEPTPGKREKKLIEVCASRRFWHGDSYSQPASLGARMALLTLDSHLHDWVPAQLGFMGEHLGAENPEAAKVFCRMRMAGYKAYRVGRLPA